MNNIIAVMFSQHYYDINSLDKMIKSNLQIYLCICI